MIHDKIFFYLEKKNILNNFIKKIDNIIYNIEFDKNLDENFHFSISHLSNISFFHFYKNKFSSNFIKSINVKLRIFIKIIDIE